MNEDVIYMNMISEYAKFSKCQFTKVGAMAINERGRIVATGVNGTLPGETNCCEVKFDKREDHVQYTKENEIHAEMNLILELASNSSSYKSLTLYVTLSPCSECMKHLLALTNEDGSRIVKRIVFKEKYHRTTDNELLTMQRTARKMGCEFEQLHARKNR